MNLNIDKLQQKQILREGIVETTQESIRDINSLLNTLDIGHKVQYLFFYGHTRKKEGTIAKDCFSQWYPAIFEVDGQSYLTAEHYMMAEKARLFNDLAIREAILACAHPSDAKKLGRKVEGFNETTWNKHCMDIVVTGNEAKFSQNPELKSFLLSTKNRILVEASPMDRVWGIGMAQDNELINNPKKWRGLNYLGFALMSVRDKLKH